MNHGTGECGHCAWASGAELGGTGGSGHIPRALLGLDQGWDWGWGSTGLPGELPWTGNWDCVGTELGWGPG